MPDTLASLGIIWELRREDIGHETPRILMRIGQALPGALRAIS